ncbi:GTPase family protein [Leptolyngbya sp. FACHB-261]|uniref:GTPase family protein n=1 Tax=Leptolyngbya sp. FACHB-261 TaxID=2692806 RepID=UPI0016860256|nr:GTPase [Leptolyngbya sp. FACHB-261]MBD2103748.1 50S ribosome-binding GTPase [Leptolyngbya sp. FACHB-261]
MVRLKLWQWIVLALPLASVAAFLLVAAGVQIQHWGVSWIWAVVVLVLAGWRWLLVYWLRSPVVVELEQALEAAESSEPLTALDPSAANTNDPAVKAQQVIQATLEQARTDPAPWEDWSIFFQRSRELVEGIARIYYPNTKHPLLNIYVPQAYALMQGTTNDVERWMQQLAPVLNQVTVGQAYQAYRTYQRFEPAARTALQVWDWAQWVLNPAAALARTATRGQTDQAHRQLLIHFADILRAEVFKNLGTRAIELYGGKAASPITISAPTAQTQTLREILAQADPERETRPVQVMLVGRTGAGKSSLINTLFDCERAQVDVLPSTDRLQDYHFQVEAEESLILWDTPGYEQVNGAELTEQVLDQASAIDLLLLVTPALDPALQMDLDFLKQVHSTTGAELPVIAVVTQVDRLRPLREWQPPYDWQHGDRPKEHSIREAVEYRAELLGEECRSILPLVTQDATKQRLAWGTEALSLGLMLAIDPARQYRLGRFLRDLNARSRSAGQIIDRYVFQMRTAQGITSLVKSPVLHFVSRLTTGSSLLAELLTTKIPVEQSPAVVSKLQMAYELWALLAPATAANFDLLAIWPLLLNNPEPAEVNARAFGQTLVEHWTQSYSVDKLPERFQYYLSQQLPVQQAQTR